MKKLLIILDPAHGEETPGKRSPDGTHREYVWSRERLTAIAPALESLGYKVFWTNETNREIGLSNRKAAANTITQANKEYVPLLVSLHNDAVNAAPEWQKRASGISVWTSPGRTTSDIFASMFIENIGSMLPDVKKRIYDNGSLDQDFENNFTVLMGDYSAMLIECMFQDNRDDVEILRSPLFCTQIDKWIIESIENCNEYVISKLNK